MSTIPVSAFADRLQALSHDELRAFVADLWSLAGWETSTDDGVVVARKGDRERRLLVLSPGRLARFRSQTPPAGRFDLVVTPRVGNADAVAAEDAALADAADLRHRLIYGCESDAAERLWAEYFDEPLRDPKWDEASTSLAWTRVALAAVSILLVVAAAGVLTVGLPFLDAESPPAQASESTLEGGLDAEIDLGPDEQTVGEPSAVAWGETVYAGTAEGTVAALDGATGETVWSTDLGSPLRSPLVSNGTVFVRSLDGVHALDAVTGEHTWNYTDRAHDDVSGTTSTRLTVVGGTVYFSDGEGLVALEAGTGQELWSTPLSGTTTDAPTVLDGTVYVTTADGALVAFDAATGTESWQAGYRNEVVQTSATLDAFRREQANDSLFVSDRSTLYELDGRSGTSGWQFESGVSGNLSQPVVLDRGSSLGFDAASDGGTTVYVADSRSYVYGFDPETGDRNWEYHESGTGLGHPTVGGPTGNESAYSVYLVGDSPVSDTDSAVIAVNASSGTERWRVESEHASVQPPTVHDGAVYAGTDSGEVMALDAANGSERWRVDTFDSVVSGTVAVATDPLDGDSVDSRVRLGAQGHHDWFAAREQSGPQTDGASVIDIDVPSTVASEEKIDVRVSLANRGDSRANTTVAVEPEWDGVPESVLRADVDLDPGQAREVTFSLGLPAEAGSYASDVRVGDELYEHVTTVVERPAHEVTGLDDPGTVWQDDEVEVVTSVRNTGEVAATTPIALEFNGEIVDSTQRTIEANETVSVTFSLSPGDVPAGEYSYSVATAGHVETASLEVLAVDRREDALPVVTNVFGVALLLSGLALGWWVLRDRRAGPRDDESPGG